MAYSANEQFSQGNVDGPRLRVVAGTIQPKSFAAGSGTLAVLTALTFNTANLNWQVFRGTVNEVNTITANATPATAGDFTLTVNGQATAAIAFDATAAEIQTALELLSTVAVGDVVAVATTGVDLGDASAVVTLTWGGLLGGQDVIITANMAGLTGNAHVLATSTAGGGAEANGTGSLKGFVWPDAIVLDASNEVIGQVLIQGKLHRDDVPLVPNIYSQPELDVALREQARDLGLVVQGLDEVR